MGHPAVTVTAAVSGPVSSSTVPSVMASASALLPTGLSTVVTTVSSAITSMTVAVQAENISMPVCSKIGVNQPPDSIHGMDETNTPIIYGQSRCCTTSSVTVVQKMITVTMLGDALQAVNAGMQGSDAVTRTNDSVIQSLLQHIQQLSHQMLKYQKQEAKSGDIAILRDAEHKTDKCNRKQSKKSVKKSHLVPSVSSPSKSSVESSDSDSDGDTEALLSTSSQSRQGAPKSGQLVPPFMAKKESWAVWFARFKAVADDNEWSEQERLSVLLPKLKGAAGEYVF